MKRFNDIKFFYAKQKAGVQSHFFLIYKVATLVKSGETVMSLQNFIEFPEGPEFNCLFDPVFNKNCPFFRMKDIVKFVENNDTDFDFIAKYTGDIIEIKFKWNCILGYKCEPVISFWRLEDANSNPDLMWSL